VAAWIILYIVVLLVPRVGCLTLYIAGFGFMRSRYNIQSDCQLGFCTVVPHLPEDVSSGMIVLNNPGTS
jgi:hypothetical protein